MIPGIVAGGLGVPKYTTRIALPLTYDEVDYNTLLTWTRSGGAGPHVSPAGMVGNGYDARYLATSSLPSWLTAGGSGPLCLHASVMVHQGARNATRDVVAAICTNDANAYPVLGIGVIDDAADATLANIEAYCRTSGGTQSLPLARRTWKYQGRLPALSVGGQQGLPQGILFLDSDTILITAHYNDTLSRCYKMRIADWKVLGYFDFGGGHNHVSSICKNAAGDIWFGDFTTEDLLKVDVPASLASGTAVITLTYSMVNLTGAGAYEFVTVSGTEYLLAAEYATAGTVYLYVITASGITNGGTFSLASRLKRFTIGLRAQGITMHSAKLYLCSSLSPGSISRYDIATLITSGIDGAAIGAAEASWPTPSIYPEDVSFHPVTGDIWTGTEGRTSVGSHDGYVSWWSSPLTGLGVENHYTLNYNGSGSVTIKINNLAFDTIAWTPNQTPAAVSIGGPPAASAGQANGFFIGTIRNIVIQDSPLTRSGYNLAVSGAYEPSSLTVYTVTITNPGAESGATTGWTSEVGASAQRATNPVPYEGSQYFTGGVVVQTIMRQRFVLTTLTGLSTATLDAATMWAHAKWQMANFDAVNDTGSCGIRFLNGTPTQIAIQYGGLIAVSPAVTWVQQGVSLTKPTLSRNIDILFRADRTSGTNNDCYFDAIEMTVYKQ